MVAGELGSADHLAELIAPEAQLATCRDPGILLSQTARGSVAGIGEPRLSGQCGAFVERLEAGNWHVDLATHFDDLGRSPRESLGQRTDRCHVGSDVFADSAVTAGRGLHEVTSLVAQAHGQSVDLQLAHEPGRDTAESAGNPLAPLGQLGLVHSVVEACHRHPVDDRCKRRRQRSGADLCRRRLRRDQFRVEFLDLEQLPNKQVVVGIGDLRAVECVIALVVVGDLPTKIRSAGSRLDGLGHACECKQLCTE